MALISRTEQVPGENKYDLIDQDVDTIVGELNKGIDPSSLPNGRITLDKLAYTRPGTASTGYLIANVAAGTQGAVSFSVSTNNLGLGMANGLNYPISVYADFFQDPTGGGGAITVPSIYASNTPDQGAGKFIGSVYLQSSTSSITPQMFRILAKIYNFDTVSHYYYIVLNFCVINSAQTTTT